MGWSDYSPLNPRRPPDWRWRRAGDAVSGRLPASRRRDDAWSLRACRFRARLERAGESTGALDGLAATQPDLFYAYRIWQGRDSGARRTAGGRQAHELEAWVLAGCDDAEIGRRIAARSAIVAAYRALFFDVADRLSNDGYIRHEVIGDRVYSGLRAQSDYPSLWKHWAYTGGPHVLEAILSLATDGPRPDSGRRVGAYFRDRRQAATDRIAAVAATYADPTSQFDRMEIIKVAQAAEAASASGSKTGGAGAALVEEVGAMLDGIICQPLATDSTGVRRLAIEFTGPEYLSLAAGELPESLTRDLDLEFPPVPPKGSADAEREGKSR